MSGAAPAPIGVIAHYNLLERLDAAGLGDLYRARDTRLGRTVAIRVLPAGTAGETVALIDSVRSVQVLSHPNAITVFDVGQLDDRVYVVFEFITGRALRAEMVGGALQVRRALDLAIQISDAVAEAHAAGFVHRGLSPEAVVITAKGHAKIPAHDVAVQNGLEQRNGSVRLRDYQAPEETSGTVVDERSDIYSIGAILYEMLTARQPTPRGSAAPSVANARVPAEVDAVVLKAVAPNPDSRYQSAATLAAALRAASAKLRAGEDEAHEALNPRPSTSSSSVAITALMIIALAVAAIVWWFMRS